MTVLALGSRCTIHYMNIFRYPVHKRKIMLHYHHVLFMRKRRYYLCNLKAFSNIRIRPDEIKFESRSMHRYESGFEVTKWSRLTKEFNGFSLSVNDGACTWLKMEHLK